MGRRRVWGAIAAGMVALALLPVGGAGAQTDDAGSVTVAKSGWWSQSNQGADTPNGAITPPLPRSPVVPEESLPVTAFLGQVGNMSAIGFSVPEGMEATNLIMRLPLAEGGGADSGGAQAKIAACVITSYWEGGDNGKWAAKPEWDCGKAKAAGKRNDDGSWTFDLTSIATLWTDAFESVPADSGVALVPDDSTATFQVAFAKDKVELEATLTEVTAPGDDAFTADVSQETISAGAPTYSINTGSLPPPSAGGGPARASGNGGGGGAQLAVNRGDDVGNLTGNLPLGLLLLVPFAVALAVLAGQSTRRARPELVRRQGGVGRALAARAVRPV